MGMPTFRILAEKLQAEGWLHTRPRELARHFHSDRAVLFKTSEKVGVHTPYAFALRREPTEQRSEWPVQVWIDGAYEKRIVAEKLLRDLLEKTKIPGTRLVLASADPHVILAAQACGWGPNPDGGHPLLVVS